MERTEQGVPLCLLGTAQDITARKEAEEALRASEERYRVLAELSPQALWAATAEGEVTYANRRLLEYIGRELAPGNGRGLLDCFDAKDREHLLAVWGRSVETGQDFVVDARLIRAADGEARWWHLRALPVLDERGAVQQWLGIATDVHESRMTAERLSEQYAEIDRQRRELEAVYCGAPIGMALYEPKELRLIRLNDQQAQILGLAPEEALGRSFDELAGDFDNAKQVIRRRPGENPC